MLEDLERARKISVSWGDDCCLLLGLILLGLIRRLLVGITWADADDWNWHGLFSNEDSGWYLSGDGRVVKSPRVRFGRTRIVLDWLQWRKESDVP